MLSCGPTWARTRDPLIMSQILIFVIICYKLLSIEFQVIMKWIIPTNCLNLC